MPLVYKSVSVVSTPALNIQEYIGNVASKQSNISACLVTVTSACEEPFQIAEFDEYLLVTAGLLVVTHAEGTTVARHGQGLFLRKGMRIKISWPGPCQYIPICLPAFSPGNCHREEENGLMKDRDALKRLEDLHVKEAGYVRKSQEGMLSCSRPNDLPVVHKSVDVVQTGALTITEYFGNVASKDPSLSACLATVTAACEEAYQTPLFDEYVLVIGGSVVLRHGDGNGAESQTVVRAGEGVLLKAGERVKWVWPGACQYVPICLPAFTPANCGREEESTAVETPEVKKRLRDLHEEAHEANSQHFKRSKVKKRDLQSLPKANLHIHLEGAMRIDTLKDLCKKHGIDCPQDTRRQRFPNFDAFAAVYIAACECLRDESDLFRLVREVAEDAKAAGARWVEAALSQSFYQDRFGGLEGLLGILLRAADAAESATGVAIAYIVAAERFKPVREAESMAKTLHNFCNGAKAVVNGRAAVVGFGLHANEEGFPPEPFLEAFKTACGEGSKLVPLPHAGEIPPAPGKGADSVRYCVDVIGAPRIGHGVLAAENDELVAHLAQKGICLDICPTSNYLLRVVNSVAEHPLPRLLAAGVPCSIGPDDPLLFGCDLLDEYTVCRDEMGLSDAELAACARFSFVHSRAPEDIKKQGIQDIAKWLEGN